jgi:3'-phosphoadenosine 5'-phosphosulfate sulfotransferase (PAPS reductase)/FAD synthetase
VKVEMWQLKQRQSLSLEAKITLSNSRIREWYKYWNGEVYVSFSGGKDSTVLLDLVRRIYPEVPAVFVDTGLEYPEIREFVKTIDNVVWLKPEMKFNEVVEKYGYPVISKIISMGVSRYRNTKSGIQKKLRLYGGINPSSGKKQNPTISKKWHYLINSDLKISNKCCDVMKKYPIYRYEKISKKKGFVGMMAEESFYRQYDYTKTGCNAFDLKKPISKPISFWLDRDIWKYIKVNKLNYSDIYNKGENRTGCIFCMFGVHLEKGLNRFQRMKIHHPRQYDYCINKLGCGKVLDLINVKY